MDRNNIIAAPSTEEFSSMKEEWSASVYNDGTTDFYAFMTTPSAERTAFLRSRKADVAFYGLVTIRTFK